MTSAASVATVATIRSHFPALERVHRGAPVAYFDGPGGTQVPRAVPAAMTQYLCEHNANTHWAYPSSIETDAALAHARQVFAQFLNGAPHEILFGANMTTLTLHLARALARRWAPGDEVVVTELDHHANVDPWLEAARDRGLTVRTVRLDPAAGTLDWQDLERCVTRRTRLLAIGAASNALGTVTDVAGAAALAHAVGALCFVDGVHYAPHALPDMRALGCDAFACSPYKFHGPHLGVLWMRRDLLAETPFPKLAPASDSPPERGETGTLNHEGIVGAAAGVEWLASLAGDGGALRDRLRATFEALHGRSTALVRTLWEALATIPGIRAYGPPPSAPRTPTVGFVLQGVPSERVARALADLAVFVSHGDFYASTAVARLGHQPDGLVRAGCACYTTEQEVACLIDGVRGLSRR